MTKNRNRRTVRLPGRLNKMLRSLRLRRLYGKQDQGIRIKCPECGSIVVISEIKKDKSCGVTL